MQCGKFALRQLAAGQDLIDASSRIKLVGMK